MNDEFDGVDVSDEAKCLLLLLNETPTPTAMAIATSSKTAATKIPLLRTREVALVKIGSTISLSSLTIVGMGALLLLFAKTA